MLPYADSSTNALAFLSRSHHPQLGYPRSLAIACRIVRLEPQLEQIDQGWT
ncbi:MAG TPA: hypothetical protein VK211_23880 [Kamptonema sp.]|nr:hypothetical protein [Kamptonema sp.]